MKKKITAIHLVAGLLFPIIPYTAIFYDFTEISILVYGVVFMLGVLIYNNLTKQENVKWNILASLIGLLVGYFIGFFLLIFALAAFRGGFGSFM